MIEITGLWMNTDSNGRQYLVGYMGNAKVLIFANKFKETDKQPSHIMYLAPKDTTQKDSTEQDQNIDF